MVKSSNTIGQNRLFLQCSRSCVALGKFLNLSEPVSSSLESDPKPHSINHTVPWGHLHGQDLAERSQED